MQMYVGNNKQSLNLEVVFLKKHETEFKCMYVVIIIVVVVEINS